MQYQLVRFSSWSGIQLANTKVFDFLKQIDDSDVFCITISHGSAPLCIAYRLLHTLAMYSCVIRELMISYCFDLS